MKFKAFLLTVFIVLMGLVVADLFHPGLPITHDGQDHVARIANFYINLQSGVILPRWAPNLNWGYGHPILEFLYPFPSYVASFFHLLSFSLVDSYKIVMGLGMVASGVAMLLWLSSFLGIEASVLGAILYVYAPYRFIDTYVRGDIGENLAFVFVPLTLFFLLKFSKNKNFPNFFFGSVSLALLILSHNAVSLMMLPFILLYCLYLLLQEKKEKTFGLLLVGIIAGGFLLSAFFWTPGLLEGKFTLRNIITAGAYKDTFVTWGRLFYGPWNYGINGVFTVQLGIIQWVAIILSPVLGFVFYKQKRKDFLLVAIALLNLLGAIFLMLPVSKILWQHIMLLQNFQFAWRFLGVAVLTGSILGAYFIEVIPKNIKTVGLIFFIAVILFVSQSYWHAQGYKTIPDSFFTGIYNGTTDTGESGPIWSVRGMGQRPKSHMQMIDGDASVVELKRTPVEHVYKIIAQRKTLMLENTLYFPGWEINIDGAPTVIQFQNQNYRGLMTFFIDKGTHIVDVKYQETRLRLVSDILSIFTFAGFILYGGFRLLGGKKK